MAWWRTAGAAAVFALAGCAAQSLPDHTISALATEAGLASVWKADQFYYRDSGLDHWDVHSYGRPRQTTPELCFSDEKDFTVVRGADGKLSSKGDANYLALIPGPCPAAAKSAVFRKVIGAITETEVAGFLPDLAALAESGRVRDAGVPVLFASDDWRTEDATKAAREIDLRQLLDISASKDGSVNFTFVVKAPNGARCGAWLYVRFDRKDGRIASVHLLLEAMDG